MTQLYFLEKELSWLSFNHRVLQEAQNENVPLLERVRFLGIYSNNMDEFYRVSVANVRREVSQSSSCEKQNEALSLLDAIQAKVIALLTQFEQTYQLLLQQLREQNIYLINEQQLAEHHKSWLEQYYKEKLRQHIFPLIVDAKTKLSEQIDEDGNYLVTSLQRGNDSLHGLIKIPSAKVPRFIQLPDKKGMKGKYIILLDNAIRHWLPDIFSCFFEFDSIHAYSIKLTRDAEFTIINEFNQSLYQQVSQGLKERVNGQTVRLVYDQKMPKPMLNILKQQLGIESDKGLIPGGRYHSFRDFIEFPDVGGKKLVYKKLPPLESHQFTGNRSVFDAIKRHDILLYYPYHKFSHFTEFLRQATYDPKVTKLEICVYRLAKNSRVAAALIEAVKNKKQVEVNIELLARFDENENMAWAKVLSNAGVKITFGIPNLKVHAKVCLITRRESKGLVRYALIGSGNFHEKNAKLYTDFALFTCHKEVTNEVAQVFEFIKNPYLKYSFNHLIVSPLHARFSIENLIDKEIVAALNGQPCGITLKVNNLVDYKLIEKLYEANNAGVKIRLIVRGICSLVTGVANQSENITAISIVDRYLEHARVYIFENGGDKKVYISSADWMSRNLDQRVEVACPVYDPQAKQTIVDILNIQLADNVKARILDSKQSNQYQKEDTLNKVRSQIKIYNYLKSKL